MRSSNPVFSRRGFSRDNGYAGFNTAPQAGGAAVGTQGNPYAQPQAGNPYATNPYAQQDLQHGAPPQAPATTGRMTMDDVVLRTGTTLGILIVTAALAWALLPVDDANIGRSYGIAIGAALVAHGPGARPVLQAQGLARADPVVRRVRGRLPRRHLQHRRQPHRRAARPCRR